MLRSLLLALPLLAPVHGLLACGPAVPKRTDSPAFTDPIATAAPAPQVLGTRLGPVDEELKCFTEGFRTCKPEASWSAAPTSLSQQFNPDPDLERNVFDFYIGRVTDQGIGVCIEGPGLYANEQLKTPMAGQRFIVVDKKATMTATQLVSSEALERVVAAANVAFGARFTEQARAEFQAAFLTEIKKRAEQSANTAGDYEVAEYRLDGGFGQVLGLPWISKFPIFAKCEGLRLITGIKGIYVRSVSAAGVTQAEKSLLEAARVALEAALGAGAYTAEVKGSLEVEIKKVTTGRAELQVTMQPRFIPVWIRSEVVGGLPYGCVDTTQVRSQDDQKLADSCRGSLTPGRRPTKARLQDGKLLWVVDSPKAARAIRCECEAQTQ